MTAEEFQRQSGVSRETLAAFERWRALLAARNQHLNLVGRSTLDDFWGRHALDSLQLLDHAPEAAKLWADVGSGAGFPGLAIALGLQGQGRDGRVVLIESIAKKAAFLREAVAETGAPATVRNARAEALDTAERFDIVTARAVAPLTKLLGLCEPLLKTGALGLFLKGARHADELTEARKCWTFDAEVIPSRTPGGGAILKLKGVRRAR
ncbi:MAG: 16S rRNA (guanine(527)-N(7))-methyltransferase RsmG [Maricaulaceae bacterium]|nr:16S rRNA (guanine(527)-N(7))-methyltransferase RsmG [Maricaulaceae bacterium]